MRKWKLFVLTGSMVAALSMLAGCEDTKDNGERKRLEYDKDDDEEGSKTGEEAGDDGNTKKDDTSGKEDGRKEDSGKENDTPAVVEGASGYDSSDEAIQAFWEGIATCSEDQLYSCFLDENVIPESAFQRIAAVVDSQYQVALARKDQIDIHTDKLSIDSVSVDPEDLPSHITNIVDIDEANISTVVVPLTQTVNGDDYEVNDNYEISTILVGDKWYVESIDNLGTDVVSQPNVTTGGNRTTDPSDWCTFTTTNGGIKVVYGSGMDDGCEIAEGVTFGDICDAFENSSYAFNRETYRQIMTLSFGSDVYLAALQQADPDSKAHALALLAEIAHTIDKVDGTVTQMTAQYSAPTVSVFTLSTPAYGECTLYADGNTGEIKLSQPKTGNESQGVLKEEDVAVWEEIAKEALNQ